jgi:hypothetical protein
MTVVRVCIHNQWTQQYKAANVTVFGNQLQHWSCIHSVYGRLFEWTLFCFQLDSYGLTLSTCSITATLDSGMLQGEETRRFRYVDHLLFLSRATFTSESVRDDSEKMYCECLGYSAAAEFCSGVMSHAWMGVVPGNSHYWASTCILSKRCSWNLWLIYSKKYFILMPWLPVLELLSLILGMKRDSEDILGSETG